MHSHKGKICLFYRHKDPELVLDPGLELVSDLGPELVSGQGPELVLDLDLGLVPEPELNNLHKLDH